MGAISSKGTANRSWSTNAKRSAGVRRSSTTMSGGPIESASSTSWSGSSPGGDGTSTGSTSSAAVADLAHVAGVSGARGAPGVLGRRDRRVSRQMWATTVVSHPWKFSMRSGSARRRRSHASWTASSASATEPTMR